MFISGSSPLTRGTRESVEKDRNKFRFIPAYAGNSFPAELRRRIVTVHPRLRGELLGMAAVIAVSSGSSPLTRGTPTGELLLATIFPVHPRLRGELSWSRMQYFSIGGSSPLTRGTLIALGTDFGFFRFIPAYARNSLLADLAAFFATVHPRLRGELHGKSRAADYRAGSSPLTRGTR